jgi:hypothetical protein
MKPELFELALSVFDAKSNPPKRKKTSIPGTGLKKVTSRTLSYTHRHRGQWFRPEYDLEEIQIAQDTDSYLFKALQKKTNRFMIAGWEVVGDNLETLDYVKGRLREIELATNTPFNVLVTQTAHDLVRYSNCMWAKVRDNKASSGKIRTSATGKELDPVAGYFILPFETLRFKTKSNGDIKKLMQRTPYGETKEFPPDDIVHFYTNKKPGFAIGTPEVSPVLDDIALLRRIEENVEELIESNLYPLFHYQVGSDAFPERYGPDGIKETDVVKTTLEYMPAGGIYISDHRHSISAIGSEGRALRIDTYLEHFKKRVFAGLGVSGVDMGEGDTSNRSTANALSKSALQDVEALQQIVKEFIEFYIFNELLLEGGYVNELSNRQDRVYIKFGIVDKEERSRLENQTIQLWLNNLLTEHEARKDLGLPPVSDEAREDTNFKLYQEPLALLKFLGFAAADDALSESVSSSITSEGVKRGEAQAERTAAVGRPANPSSVGAQRANEAKVRPENQNGKRTAQKYSRDAYKEWLGELEQGISEIALAYAEAHDVDNPVNSNYLRILIENYEHDFDRISMQLDKRLTEFKSLGVKSETILDSFKWRFRDLTLKYVTIAQRSQPDLTIDD